MPRYSFDAEEPEDLHPPPSSSQSIQPTTSVPYNPTAHPDSAIERLRAARRYSSRSRSSQPNQSLQQQQNYAEPVSPISSISPPAPPLHRDTEGRIWGREVGYSPSQQSLVTSGEDNIGSRVHGGIAGVAMNVADANPRESGVEAMRNTPAHNPQDLYPYNDVFARPPPSRQEYSSFPLTPFGAMPSGMQTPNSRSSASAPRSLNSENPYSDTAYPYSRGSRNLEDFDPSMGFDPSNIEDDGDDGLHYGQAKRGSMLSLGQSTDHLRGAPAGAAATGGFMDGLFGGRKGSGDKYDPANAHVAPGGPAYDLDGEKNGLAARAASKKRKKWFIMALGALLIAGAIAGSVAGGVLSSQNSTSKSNSGQSASSDTAANGDLNKDSTEIKNLMNNANLHKVFPGIDYTPMNTQYPDCLNDPPSNNNITRDLAVLSQLTNTIRLYGTDCNQTEMLMHSISQLDLNDTIKVWLGVWQDTNTTTNERQLTQLYDILDKYPSDQFLGVIVGNEVLYRKDMTESELVDVIDSVRSNLTSKDISLPVASSDLGDNWTSDFASKVDYVMANIHPFFAGQDSSTAAAWTYNFWQSHDASLVTNSSKNIISETGWPSQGGTDCGGASSCTNGATAGIDEMNEFMNSWICQALNNGTNYFWFEAFDEPWKIKFDTGGQNWEDHWGLLTSDRVLKKGVEIPDCGGKTV